MKNEITFTDFPFKNIRKNIAEIKGKNIILFTTNTCAAICCIVFCSLFMKIKVKFVHIHAMKAYRGVHVQLHGSL
jgi:hypothetical protein